MICSCPRSSVLKMPVTNLVAQSSCVQTAGMAHAGMRDTAKRKERCYVMADVVVGDSLTMMVESILSRPTTLIALNAPLLSLSSALRGVSWSLAAHTSAAKGPGTRSAVAPHQDQEGWVCPRHYIQMEALTELTRARAG